MLGFEVRELASAHLNICDFLGCFIMSVVSLHSRCCLITHNVNSSMGYYCCFIIGLCFFMQPSWCCFCFITCWCCFITLASTNCSCCCIFDGVVWSATNVVVSLLNHSFLFFVQLNYCCLCFIDFFVFLHWATINTSSLNSCFFGVIRLLIFVVHETTTTFEKSKRIHY